MRLYVMIKNDGKWRRVVGKGDGWVKVRMNGEVVRVSTKRITESKMVDE